MNFRSLVASTLIAGSLWSIGCTQKPPEPTPAPPKPPATTPAAASPAAASPAAASPAAAPSAAASTAPASPAAASPAAKASESGAPAAKGGPVEYKRVEYENAGVEFDVPTDFTKFEKMDEWLASVSGSSDMAVFVRSKEWKEWDDVLKACEDTFHGFKASDEEVTKGKTQDGIEVWYDYGVAQKKDGKPVFAVLSGYLMEDHDFIMVVLGDPNDPKVKEIATHMLTSVTRQAKYQNKGGEGKGDKGGEDKGEE